MFLFRKPTKGFELFYLNAMFEPCRDAGHDFLKCANSLILSIRCILGDIRLWVGDTSTSSCRV